MVLICARHLLNDCHCISERLRIAYVSAAEGLIFSNLIKEMTRQMEDLGQEKIKAENTKLRPVVTGMLARKGLIPAAPALIPTPTAK